MPLADLLHPEQRQWLRRLRRRIANRTGQAVPLLDDLSTLGDPCLRW